MDREHSTDHQSLRVTQATSTDNLSIQSTPQDVQVRRLPRRPGLRFRRTQSQARLRRCGARSSSSGGCTSAGGHELRQHRQDLECSAGAHDLPRRCRPRGRRPPGPGRLPRSPRCGRPPRSRSSPHHLLGSKSLQLSS